MLALLQAAATLLALVQSPAVSTTTAQNSVNLAENAIQIVAQETAPIDFTVPKDNSIWPNITDLVNAPYLDGNGNYVPLGSAVSLLEQDTSFGDINNDGIDDAAVIVNRPTPATGAPNYFLAVMLNQGGIMFNIADYPLGNTVNINSHHVTDGNIIIDGNQYELWGDQIEKVL
jgi:hypothetical protein